MSVHASALNRKQSHRASSADRTRAGCSVGRRAQCTFRSTQRCEILSSTLLRSLCSARRLFRRRCAARCTSQRNCAPKKRRRRTKTKHRTHRPRAISDQRTRDVGRRRCGEPFRKVHVAIGRVGFIQRAQAQLLRENCL